MVAPLGPAGGPSVVRAGDPGGPFAPVAVVLHPLTHDDAGADGARLLIVHIEMRDRWGDPTKGVGVLRLVVFSDSARGAVVNDASNEAVAWSVDLRDLSVNARLYDPTTKTYRIMLSGVDGVLAAAGGPGGRLRLGAVMQAVDVEGGVRVLRDTRELVVGE